MRRAVFCLASVLLLASVQSYAAEDAQPGKQFAPDPDLDRPNRTYDACLQLTRKQPDKALELAGKWIALGGTEAAHHCQALALIGMKDYGEGATRLEALVQQSIQPPLVRANMLAQAAQAWMLQGEPTRAYSDQTAALKLAPPGSHENLELLLDRATTLAEGGKYDDALIDVDAALKIDATNGEALAFRASAHRSMGKMDEALADAEHAISVNPDNVAALLERGNLYRLKKRTADARKDWLHILQLETDSAAAEAARTNIENMDVNTRAR